MKHARLVLVCLFACLLAAPPAAGQIVPVVPDGFAVQPLVQNLSAPTALQFMPDGRILFVEQFTGNVRVYFERLVGGHILIRGVQTTPVLHVPDLVVGGERGLLGVALDPAFPARPYLYVHYTAAPPNHVRIARWTLTGDLSGTGDRDLVADPLSRYDLIDDIPDAAANHNGGTVRFAADGLLYVSLGEDGVPCAAQDTTQLRGKILRLQTNTLPAGAGRAFRAQITPFDNPFVSRPDSNARLVAALGLRNPFRIQPDRVRNWLVIGDVGENVREELDVLVLHLPTARPPRPELGADFGWPFFEGTVIGPTTCGPLPPNLAAPVFDYDRTLQNGAAIIAAGAYWATGTGSYDFPDTYAGDLFASDYYSGTLYHLVASGNGYVPGDVPGQPAPGKWGTGFNGVSDWALGRDGAFYYCRQATGLSPASGEIGRIICTTTPPPPAPELPLELRVAFLPANGAALFLVPNEFRLVLLKLYDTTGRLVRTFPNNEFFVSAGGLSVFWDGRDADGRKVPPGMYLGKLESMGRTATARVPFLR
jgi:glucose/arabinose dehydrogenase